MLGHSQPVTRRGDVRDWCQPRSVAAPAAGDRRARLPRNHGRVAPWRRSRPSSRVDGWHGSWRDRAWSPVRPGRVGVTGLAVAVPHHPTWSSRRRAERASRESPGSALERTPFTSPRAFWQRAQKTPNARKAGRGELGTRRLSPTGPGMGAQGLERRDLVLVSGRRRARALARTWTSLRAMGSVPPSLLRTLRRRRPRRALLFACRQSFAHFESSPHLHGMGAGSITGCDGTLGSVAREVPH